MLSLSLLDGELHRVSFYFVDWDKPFTRVQLIEVLDAGTDRLLETHTLSNFQHGVYLSYLVRAAIKVRISSLSGESVVLSGVFVDRAQTEPPAVKLIAPLADQKFAVPQNTMLEATAVDEDGIESVQFFVNGASVGVATHAPYQMPWRITSSGSYAITAVAIDTLGAQQSASLTVTGALPSAIAEFIRIDSATQGDWIGVYGSDGFAIPGYLTNYPAYATVNLVSSGARVYFTENEPRELEKVDSPERILSCWGITGPLELRFLDGETHLLAFYFTDPERARAEQLTIRDAETQAVLYDGELLNFSDGQYLVFKVRGHLSIDIAILQGPGAVLGGLFFDPLPIQPAQPIQLRATPRLLDDRLTFTVMKMKSAVNNFAVEMSEDLIQWFPADDGITEIERVDWGNFEEVTLQVNTSVRLRERCFLRLRMTAGASDTP